ncbi:MAG: hypothetical protein GXP38_05265 [Chloroflexi bacterium]|nr:hypothetical protein [Chloroflexota bacterium]
MKRVLRSPAFWLTTLLSLFAIAPFLHPGYFWSANDARHDVFFILQYNLSWDEGVLFPRWSPDWAFGYGYPFFSLVAPAATFVGTFLHRFLSLSLESSVKGTFILSILLSAWGMWLFVRDWAGERAAMLAALVYVYAPYHLLDMYVRAAMGESLALALVPFSLWSLRRLVFKPSPRRLALFALTYTAIHLTHNLIALLSTGLLVIYLIWLAVAQARRETSPRARRLAWLRSMLVGGSGLGLGLALAAFFVFPALLEFRYVRQDQWFGGYYDFHDHFVYFAQLFDPRWGFGNSVPGPDDPISFQLGLAPWFLAALAAWRWLRNKVKQRWEVGFWFLLLLGSVWLTTGAASWAWDHVPLIATAQFPWRYLSLAIIALAALAAVAVETQSDTAGDVRVWLAPLLLAGLVILSSSRYLRIETPAAPPGGATLAGLMEFERSANEMTGMTITADEIATWSPLADLHMAGIEIGNQVDYSRVDANDQLFVDVQEHRVDSELVWVRALSEGQRVPFYRQWFPGWTATIMDPDSGQQIDRFALTPADTRPPYGLLDVPVPKGDHLLRISFENTPVRTVSNLISLISLGLWVLLVLRGRWFTRLGNSLLRRFSLE